MSYGTQTATYTVVDIRKTFESLEADLRMIARRTAKWTQEQVSNNISDILLYAESKYLDSVDVALVSNEGVAIKATKFTVDLDGKTMSGDRAGGNNWPNLPNTRLKTILTMSATWWALSESERNQFEKTAGFKTIWGSTNFNTSYPHLQSSVAQTYGNKGYELTKRNFS